MNCHMFAFRSDSTLDGKVLRFPIKAVGPIQEGRYIVVEDTTESFRHLSLFPHTAGDIEVLVEKDKCNVVLSDEMIRYLELRNGELVSVLGRYLYTTLWKHRELFDYIHLPDGTLESLPALQNVAH